MLDLAPSGADDRGGGPPGAADPAAVRKPFVKRSKTDSADAEAICEALRCAGIRDVAVKSRDQQAALVVNPARDLLVRQRTILTDAIRGFAAEFGIVTRQGPWHVSALRGHLKDIDADTVPAAAGGAMALLFDQFDDLGERIDELEQRFPAWHRASDVSRRLATVPGIVPLNATRIAATVAVQMLQLVQKNCGAPAEMFELAGQRIAITNRDRSTSPP